MSLSLLARKARLDALRLLINASGGGAVHLYALPQAAAPEAAAASAPLAIVALAPDCAVIGESGTLAAMALVPVVGYAAASGSVGWARFVNGAGVAVQDLPVGAPGSGQPVIITDNKPAPSAVVFAGGEVQVASAVWLE